MKQIKFSEPESLPKNEISDGVYYLLVDRQIQIQEKSNDTFRHYAIKIINKEGLSYMSQVMVDFDPSYQNLFLHSVLVYRRGKTTNKLKRNNISILQRETELDYQIYNGSKTANLILDDIRVGDIIEYSYTISGANPVLNSKYYGDIDVGWSVPVHQFFLRILCPNHRELFIKKHGTEIPSSVVSLGGLNEYVFTANKLSAIIREDNLPEWYLPFPWIQISEAETWNDIASWGAELFSTGKTLSEELWKQTVEIKKSISGPAERILESLRFVQDEIRYLGIEVGPGSYSPSDPSVTMKRRFGDCKDKTYLLCTMLREMGISAVPALVNTSIKDKIETFQPTPFAFNHVIARVSLNGQYYWIDPTLSHQSGELNNLYQPDYGKALVLDKNTQSLCDMCPPRLKEAAKIVTEEFDLSRGISKPCYFTVTTRLIGRIADRQRRRFLKENKNKIEKDCLNFYASEYPSVKMAKNLSVDDDQKKNTIVIREYYEITDFWKYSESKYRHEGYYYAGEINDLIKTPDTTIRTMPFGISFPVHHIQQVIIHLPIDLRITDKNVEVNDKSFFFSYKKHYKNQRIHLRYEYQSLKDVVEVEDIQTYLENIKKIRKQLSYRFFKKLKQTNSFSDIDTVAIVAIIFGSVFIAYIFLYLGRLRRSEYVVSLLEEGNIKQFMKEINNDINNTAHPKMKNILTINKTGGLFYKGEWGFALSLLNSINPEHLPNKFKILYYNNKLSLLLISEHFERANNLYTKHSAIIESGLRNKKLKTAVKSTLSTYEMYFGDIGKSKEMFLSLLESNHTDFSTSLIYYYLGLIESKYNNVNMSLEYFNKAKKLGGCSFIPEKADAIKVNGLR